MRALGYTGKEMDLRKKKTILELIYLSFICVVATRLIKAAFILVHNIVEDEQWTYIQVFNNFQHTKTWAVLLSPVFIAPLIETLLFCSFLHKIITKLKLGNWLFIAASSLLFGAYHLLGEGHSTYSFAYTAVCGFIFAFFYCRVLNRFERDTTAYFLTSLLHSMSNLISAFV